MLDLLFIPIGILYVVVILLLFIYGLNFYYLTYLAIRLPAPSAPAAPTVWPKVTVQLPVYNELYVVRRLIDSAASLDYPPECLEIQVLDDFNDATTQLIQRVVAQMRRRGLNIVHLHRSERTGYKAGALAEGIQQANGEFLAIFDADFVPHPDFLKRTIPYFQDSGIAFLQTRWSHLNPGYSLLTFLQSLIIDSHFAIEQVARSRADYWFNFNGTAGVWRKSAVEAAGGWQADTLTEDLDLSYRVLLGGWRAVYLPHVEVPAELPVTITAYRRQQYRWARGSLEVAYKHLGEVLHAPIPIMKKFQAVMHLSGYGVHLLLFLIALLYPAILVMPVLYPGLLPLFYLALLFNLTMFAQTFFFAAAQRQLGRPWWRLLPAILFVSILGAGMMLNTVRAAWQILTKKRVGFERTPKFGIQQRRQNWNRTHYQLGLDRIVFYELGFALFNGWSCAFAVLHHNWVIAFYAFMFSAGLLFTSGLSLQQALVHRLVARPAPRSDQRHAANIARSTGTERLPSRDRLEAIKERLPAGPWPGKAAIRSGDDLGQAILQTVAYADIFDYAITGKEILRYLTKTPASSQQVSVRLEAFSRSRRLSRQGGLYTLPGREDLAKIRRQRAAIAEELWKPAIRYGRAIARLPFVRMLAVTGALAMDNAEAGADIDYLIVTEPGRLWLCRGAGDPDRAMGPIERCGPMS